jgi:hypothetical protein
MARLLLAHALEVLLAGAVLGDPLAGERPVLDFPEDLLHRGAGGLADDAAASRQVAVLGRVGDRVAHPADALLVHEVDDQLEFVQALEVGELGVIAGVDQRLVARAHQLGEPAAQDGLLAEQVGLGLVLERRLDDPGAGGADALRVGQRKVAGFAAGVLVDGDQGRHSAPLGELAPHEVAGALGRDHGDVDVRRRVDLVEVDGEAVAEHQQVAGRDPVADLLLPHLPVALVGHEHHHDVGARGRIRRARDLQPPSLRLVDRRRIGPQADHDVDPGLLEVERVGVALGAVADDRDGLAVELL